MIDVTCAVIRNDEERVLVVQHGDESDHPGMWEFPGGKIKKGESAEECIIREIREELSISVVICHALTGVVYDYGFRKIRLIPFVCDTIDFAVSLNEHAGYRWTEACDLLKLPLTEADIPVAEEYISLFAGKDAGEEGTPSREGALTDSGKDETGEAGTHFRKGALKDLNTDGTKETGADGIRDAVVNSGGRASEPNKSELPDLEGVEALLTGSISVDVCRMLADVALEEDYLPPHLLKIALTAEYPVSFRASWALTLLDEKDQSVMAPLLREMVDSLPSLDSESVIRSFLKILGRADIKLLGENEHGILTSSCFNWLNSPSTAIAIKAYSMEILYKLTRIYPSIEGELITSIAKAMENGSAGVKAKARMVLERLRKK